MEKISSQEVEGVLKTAADTIRILKEDNDSLREKVASFEKRARVEALARSMEDRGLQADLSFEEKVAALESHSNIDAVEEAVKMAASPGNAIRLSKENFGGLDSKSALEQFILSGDDPS